MILEMVLGLFLAVSGGGKAEVDPTTTILKMLVKGNEIQKEEKARKQSSSNKQQAGEEQASSYKDSSNKQQD